MENSISIVGNTISNQEKEDNVFEKYSFESVITKLEKPIGKGCPVYFLNSSTGQIIYKTETDEFSKVYAPNLRKYVKYLVIATDILDVYNSVVFDLTWDFSSPLKSNYSLSYYNIYDLDNIQSIFEYKELKKLKNNTVISNLSIALVKDDVGLSWSAFGPLRRGEVAGIAAYAYNGSSYIYLPKGLFYQKLPFTFEAFFKVEETSTTNQYILLQSNSANKSYSLAVTPSLDLVFNRQAVVNSIPEITLTSLSKISLNKNYHVAVCFDGNTMYLFLNGILQTTVSDFNGIPYINTNMIIGQSFIGSIGNTSFDASCKYTSDFSMLFEPFSYYPKVYDNPSDSLANYVSLKIRSNKLSPQPMIEDLAKNVRFDNAVALDTSKEFLKVGAYNSSVSSYKGVSLGTQDFCIEVSAKVLSKLSVSPSLISNAETSSQWTSNIWYLLFNSSTTPNKYSFSLYSSSPWASNYPSILKEQIDLAIVREGTKLRIYVNGFLDAEYTIAANLNFDNRVGAYYSFGRDIVFNLYDLKITQGKARYTAEYEPSLIDIQDKDILAAQYRILNLPLKKVLVDYDTPLTLTANNVGIVNKQSINGTYSGYFDGAVSSITCASWWTNKEKFSAECFLYPQEITTTVQTLYSLYSTTAELLKIGIKDGTLGYQNGANWVATTYVLDPLKFNHIVIQRNKTTLKLLADGALVATYTVPATLGTDLKFTIGASKGTAEYLKGYLNNIFVYKNYIKYEDAYEVPYEEIVPPDEGEIEPEVIVNASTTSALDFENLYLDKIPTTVWTKQGTTSNLNIVNKIFGTASFETKSLDDSLSTNSIILSGGAVPFTIEFYALIKGLTQGGSATGIWQPFLSKNVNVSNGSQVFGINNRKVYFDRGSGVGSTLNYTNPKGILISNNEINKYTISYDGSAIRIFVNNNLEYVAGTLVGLVNTAEPFRFFHNLVPSYPAYRVTTTGIIDNINIFNGIATKVREYDEYEENLIVDLAFNGENNSTKIVDNGKNEDEFYDNIISLLTFENGIQEAKGNVCTVNSGTPLFETVSPIFPNNSLNITSLNNTLNLPWTSNYNLEDKDFTIEFSVKPTGTSSGSYPALFSNRTYGSSGNNWSFLWNSGKVRAEIVTVNGSFSLTASTTMAYNTIYHIALVRKGSSLLLFLNGKIESEATIVGAMASVVAPINIGKLDRDSDSNNCVYGLYDNIRITKGVARYLSNYQVPNSNFWQKTAWGVNGDATLSTTQPFDSFSSFIADGNAKYLSTTLNLGETFTIEMEFLTPTKSDGYHIGLLDYGNGFNGANGFNVTWSSSQNIWWRSPNVNIGSSVTLSPNTVYKLTLIYANYKAQMYLNGVLVGESNATLNTGSKFFSIGYANTDWKQVNPYYINYCKIYNSIVLPESPVGKIQLDFDNNILDKYKNSTWTNSGVTYDQVNSVKGYATKFSTSTYLETNSGALDFGSNSFLIDFDLKETDKAISREIFSNNIQPNSSGSIWIPSSATNVGFDFYDRPTNVTGISSETLANNYYNHKILRKSGNIFKTTNDCLVGIYNIPSTQTFNFVQGGLLRISKPSSIFGVVNGFNGYLDNFKSYKAVADNTVLEKSITNTAVHLPLETNKENIGFTNIITSTIGSPTYTVMDSKKCIKFESGKYLTMSTNNIFNLGLTSDFYMEFDFYPLDLTNSPVLYDSFSTTSQSYQIQATPTGLIVYIRSGTNLTTTLVPNLNSWNKLKFSRKGTNLTLTLNSTTVSLTNTTLVSADVVALGAQVAWRNTAYDFNGYMSNFKLFVGIGSIPVNYNQYKILDIDFKPTRKSYLFKDNNNKCLVHPVNITQRDYQDSRYCCTFNNTDQYLYLGSANALNFGKDSFVIAMEFKPIADTTWSILIGNGATSSDSNYHYIGIAESTNSTNPSKIYFTTGGSYVVSNNPVDYGVINKLIITREGSTLTIILNDTVSVFNLEVDVNFNYNGKTQIGTTAVSNWVNHLFNGTMYSVKILRNTSDITLLEDKTPEVVIPDLRGIWINNTATWDNRGSPYATTSFMNYNPSLVNTPTWNAIYKNTNTFAVNNYKSDVKGDVIVTMSSPAVINHSPLKKKFYIQASNGTWSDTTITAELEFLDQNDNIVMVMRWLKDSTFRHGIWYGPSWSSLTKAPQVGSYPQTYGFLDFQESAVEFYSVATTNYNNGFVYSPPNYSSISKIRVTALQAYQDYTSGNGSSAMFNMFNVKDHATEKSTIPVIEFWSCGLLLRDLGTSRIIWTENNVVKATDGKSFTGELTNTSANAAYDFYSQQFTLDVVVSGSGHIFSQWQTNLRFNYRVSNAGEVIFTFYTNSGQLTASFALTGSLDRPTQLTLTRDVNGYFNLYVNGVKNANTVGPLVGNYYVIPNETARIGSSTLSIYDFKLRKGVSDFIEHLL